MSAIATAFARDHERYEGVRPIHVYLLRMFYFLMAAFVATDAWMTIISHEGPWDRFAALAFCVWAAYPTLAVLGLIHPLKMIPLMLFTIFYKSIWLLIVAYPLWRVNALWGSPAEPMTRAFLWLPLLVIAVPWGYVLRSYVMRSKPKSVELHRARAA
jgi:hypothetical protein